jgi:hypothetical protein
MQGYTTQNVEITFQYSKKLSSGSSFLNREEHCGVSLPEVVFTVQPSRVTEIIEILAKAKGRADWISGDKISKSISPRKDPAKLTKVDCPPTLMAGIPPVAFKTQGEIGLLEFESYHREIPEVVSTHLLHTPAKECVIPLTFSNVQFPVVQPIAETVRFAAGFVRLFIMFILTVGSISYNAAPGL